VLTVSRALGEVEMEVEKVRKEVEELYRELVRRKYETAREKGAQRTGISEFYCFDMRSFFQHLLRKK
jgi:hypothetical protein